MYIHIIMSLSLVHVHIYTYIYIHKSFSLVAEHYRARLFTDVLPALAAKQSEYKKKKKKEKYKAALSREDRILNLVLGEDRTSEMAYAIDSSSSDEFNGEGGVSMDESDYPLRNPDLLQQLLYSGPDPNKVRMQNPALLQQLWFNFQSSLLHGGCCIILQYMYKLFAVGYRWLTQTKLRSR